MEDFRGILNLVFWFLIYWFVFRKKKKKPAASKKSSPAGSPSKGAESPGRAAKPAPEPAVGWAGEPVGAPAGKVPSTMWNDLRKMLDGGLTTGESEKPAPESPPFRSAGRKRAECTPKVAPLAAEPAKTSPSRIRKGARSRGRRPCRLPELTCRAGLRRALVMAELLAPPVSMRRRGRRVI